jgi:hypothetical protein
MLTAASWSMPLPRKSPLTKPELVTGATPRTGSELTFAARTIRRWYEDMGSQRFPRAHELLITADGGGSNSSRSRLWKVALQEGGQPTGRHAAR